MFRITSLTTSFFSLVVLASVCSIPTISAQDATDDEIKAQIKSLIPAATAIDEEDWRRLTTSSSSESLPVTLMSELLSCDVTTEEQAKEFSYIDESRDPAILAKAISRGDHRTFVKSITEFTCEIRMEVASGVVEWEVPDLVKGRFEYKATEFDDGWSITEFSLPSNKVLLRLNEETNLWEKQPVVDE